MHKYITCGTLQIFYLATSFVEFTFCRVLICWLKCQSSLKLGSQNHQHPHKCSTDTLIGAPTSLFPGGAGSVLGKEPALPAQGLVGEAEALSWQAGQTWWTEGLWLPRQKQMVCLFGLFLRVPRLPHEWVAGSHLSCAITCTSDSGWVFVSVQPQEPCRETSKIPLGAVAVFWVPFARSSAQLENSLLFYLVEGFYLFFFFAFYRTHFFLKYVKR